MAKGIRLFNRHSVKRELILGFAAYTALISVAFGYIAFNATHRLENQVAQSRIEFVDQVLVATLESDVNADPVRTVTNFRHNELHHYPGLTIVLANEAQLNPLLRDYPLGVHDDINNLELHLYVTQLPRLSEYVYYIYDENIISNLNQQESTYIINLLAIGLALILLAIGLALLLNWRIVTPLNLLANALLSEKIKESLPGCERGDEIGILGRNLDSLLKRNEQLLQKEKLFSRHCSHELRTPVAIIENSISLLKLENCEQQLKERSIGRISGASKDIIGLIETFLMLGRKDKYPKAQRVELSSMVDSILRDLSGCLPNETVPDDVVVRVAGEINSEPSILAVLLTNVIRNAFVHCDSSVAVSGDERSLVVVNDINPHQAEGFGYGFEIISRIATDLDYRVFTEQSDVRFYVQIIF